MTDSFPRIYPILDRSFVPDAEKLEFLERLGAQMADAGVELMEYRNKDGRDADVLVEASALRKAMPLVKLVMDDRVDVALAAGFDGVHVDGGDLPVEAAKRLMGMDRLVGTSATTSEELQAALAGPASYISFGPVFQTTTKKTSVTPIGLEGVRRFRAEAGTTAVLVAAAGITLGTAAAVLEAGASVVAVAAAIFAVDDPAAEFLRWKAELGRV